MIHLWVDPIYGDDAVAAQSNPTPSGTVPCQPFETQPNHVWDHNDPGAPVLLHASYPYKTITAAVASLPPLPTPPSPHTNVVWKYAIIHLMPGVYARGNTYWLGKYNRDNNLAANGETFPIRLPQHVSVQGTSALNTVIDLECEGPAFEFGNVLGSEPPPNGIGTFIDSVAILGADVDPSLSDFARIQPIRSSGIYIGPRENYQLIAASPTISNCFIVANWHGIIVASDLQGSVTHDGVKLFNNTFAWNRIGVWNGQLEYNSTSQVVKGLSKLIVVNNVFDSEVTGGKCPMPQAFTQLSTWPFVGTSNFEGVPAEDMEIASQNPGNYNAYEYQIIGTASRKERYNNGMSAQPSRVLPQCITRDDPSNPGNSLPDPPRPPDSRNLQPITGFGNSSRWRGVLYVRDLICQWEYETPRQLPPGCPSMPPTQICLFDYSPLDFRLSPATALWSADTETEVGPPTALNSLVDNAWSGQFPLTMQNGLTMPHRPGALPLPGPDSSSTWPFDNWKSDCEGYGNPRIWKHPAFPASSYAMDIGADELNDTVIAGYVFGTTSFLGVTKDMNQGGPLVPGMKQLDNKYVWFLGPPTGLAVSPVRWFVRPDFRIANHLTSHPANYDPPGAGWFDTWGFEAGSGYVYYKPSLAVVSPYLLPDIQAWWPTMVGGLGGTNPIWQYCPPTSGIYNTYLYDNPMAGVINPRGTSENPGDNPDNYAWVDEVQMPGVPQPVLIDRFGPFGRSDILLDQYDAWARGYYSQGGSGVFDTLPATYTGATITAIRFSVEPAFPVWNDPNLFPNDTNLQSFMVGVEQ